MDMCIVVETLAKAGSRALGALIGKTKENYDLGYGVYTQLYHSMVAPVLDYGCNSWTTGENINFRKIDQVQERAIRFYCSLPWNYPFWEWKVIWDGHRDL